MRAAAYLECRAPDGRTIWGCGIDEDIATASVRAVLSAANAAVASPPPDRPRLRRAGFRRNLGSKGGEAGNDQLGAKSPVPTAPVGPQIADDLAWSDLTAALGAGWRDFVAMPRFGMFFGGVYVLAGLAIGWFTVTGGELTG